MAHAQPSAGYIQAYPPGVRENGGQYSHAGVWALMAQAQLGHNDAAWRMFKMISPAHRWRNADQAAAYGLEPYAVAGDIYSQPPYLGRGGWSWYTGAAGWLHRAAIESIVGLQLRGDRVCFSPCLPSHWPLITVTLRRGACMHEFTLCAADHASGIDEAMRRGAVPMPVDAWRLLPAGPALQRHLLIVPAPIRHSALAELAPLDR